MWFGDCFWAPSAHNLCATAKPSASRPSRAELRMKLFGQELSVLRNQALALLLNIANWARVSLLPPPLQPKRLPPPRGDKGPSKVCVCIPGPGGLDQLQFTDIPGQATVGYNLPGLNSPFVSTDAADAVVFAPTHLLVQTEFFSCNYADICIRWGLYESALRYVGWPIVPGFDFCGRVIWAGTDTGYHEGDRVFGFTMFGAYSSRILVPAAQVRLVPTHLDSASAAALPAVAGTALHALNLAGGWSPPSAHSSVPSPSPQKPHLLLNNKAVLIHSASGGVGSLLVQVCKLAGYSPVVGVVGGAHKIAHCYRMGADVVLCKAAIRGGGGAKGGSDGGSSGSSERSISSGDGCGTGSGDLSTEIMAASPTGYTAIFDANGVDTLAQSFDQLAQNGRLIIYGFHSNLPLGVHALSPMRWLRMAWGLLSMPRFDPMAMVLESKAVLGFNLSFFSHEKQLIAQYLDQILAWAEGGLITVGEVTVLQMADIGKAHELIQSGQSVGKIVVRCPA